MKKMLLNFILLLIAIVDCSAQGKAIISGNLSFLSDVDSVRITISKYGCFPGVAQFNRVYAAKVVGNTFRLEMPATATPSFAWVNFNRLDKNISELMIEPGDDVTLAEVNGHYVFAGVHGEKYNMALHFKTIYNQYHMRLDFSDPLQACGIFASEDSTATRQLAYLQSGRNQLSAVAFALFRSNIVSHCLFKGSLLAYSDAATNAENVNNALRNYHPEQALEKALENLKDDTLAIYNEFFLRGEIVAFRRDSCFLKGLPFNVDRCFQFLSTKFSGKSREALLTWLIYNRKDQPENLKPLLDQALSIVETNEFRSLLQELNTNRLPGSEAFDFNLTDEKGQKRTFDEFKGKVVFLDFWYTGCPSCAETAPILARVESRFDNRDVIFISICIDKKQSVWLGSVSQKIYTSDRTLNLYTSGNGSHDEIIEHYKISSYPTLILIGRDGKLLSPVGDPRTDDGKRLVALINSAL